jgi:hypothetical protein
MKLGTVQIESRRNREMKRRVVSDAAVKAAGARAIKGSAKLAGCELPDGHGAIRGGCVVPRRANKARLEQARQSYEAERADYEHD